ncbi:MAG: FAD-dependent oxidoreductase [Phycisphaeraceae bacterium]|nr:FAD-dependent oxidoreductase [Phycisphaeraceae bacterium]
MKIAIIGSGISGLVVAHRLHHEHDLTIYESAGHVGGHTRTLTIDHEGRRIPVDTGFIVFNTRNYPLFTALLDELGVESQPTTMSFSVRDDASRFEYGGGSLNAIIAQRSNLLRPRFWRMIAGFRRFAAEAPSAIESGDEWTTLGTYLERERYPAPFRDHLIVPMAAAIWSTPDADILGLPLGFFVRFFSNHGMLSVRERPVWRTIVGGSRTYVDRLTAPFQSRIRLHTSVRSVARLRDGVRIRTATEEHTFDEVVFACHADQALRLLEDPTPTEREILGSLPYRPNEALLHTDQSLLPKRRRAWSAWNYIARKSNTPGVAVTYDMEILQRLGTRRHPCVTLNNTGAVDPATIIDRHIFEHPAFDVASIKAQQRHAEISGVRHTHYCGAYWFNGFHEDGVRSGARVADAIRSSRRAIPVAPALASSL